MEASWTCTNIEMSYRDSKGGRLTLLTEERGFGKADFLYSVNGLCAYGSALLTLTPCHVSSHKKTSSKNVTFGYKQERILKIVIENIFCSLELTAMLLSSILVVKCKLSYHLMLCQKKRVATSTILARSIHHSRKNTYQDNTALTTRTISKTYQLHKFLTRKLEDPRKASWHLSKRSSSTPIQYVYHVTTPYIIIVANTSPRVSMIFWQCFWPSPVRPKRSKSS